MGAWSQTALISSASHSFNPTKCKYRVEWKDWDSGGIILNTPVMFSLHACNWLDSESSSFNYISAWKEPYWLYATDMSKGSRIQRPTLQRTTCEKSLLLATSATALGFPWLSLSIPCFVDLFWDACRYRTWVPVQRSLPVSCTLPWVSTVVTSTSTSNSTQWKNISSWKWLAPSPTFI